MDARVIEGILFAFTFSSLLLVWAALASVPR